MEHKQQGKWIPELVDCFNPRIPVSLEALLTTSYLSSSASLFCFHRCLWCVWGQLWLVKWNIQFLGIFQTVPKAGFCLTLHSTLLSAVAMSCHPWSRGIIPHQSCCKSPIPASPLSGYWPSAGLPHPLWCGIRSGSTSIEVTTSY